jgi:hypothetical protein
MEDKDKLIQDLAKILEGVQVPLSIGGPTILGTAYQPILDVRQQLGLFGWPNAEEIHAKLLKALK